MDITTLVTNLKLKQTARDYAILTGGSVKFAAITSESSTCNRLKVAALRHANDFY